MDSEDYQGAFEMASTLLKKLGQQVEVGKQGYEEALKENEGLRDEIDRLVKDVRAEKEKVALVEKERENLAKIVEDRDMEIVHMKLDYANLEKYEEDHCQEIEKIREEQKVLVKDFEAREEKMRIEKQTLLKDLRARDDTITKMQKEEERSIQDVEAQREKNSCLRNQKERLVDELRGGDDKIAQLRMEKAELQTEAVGRERELQRLELLVRTNKDVRARLLSKEGEFFPRMKFKCPGPDHRNPDPVISIAAFKAGLEQLQATTNTTVQVESPAKRGAGDRVVVNLKEAVLKAEDPRLRRRAQPAGQSDLAIMDQAKVLQAITKNTPGSKKDDHSDPFNPSPSKAVTPSKRKPSSSPERSRDPRSRDPRRQPQRATPSPSPLDTKRSRREINTAPESGHRSRDRDFRRAKPICVHCWETDGRCDWHATCRTCRAEGVECVRKLCSDGDKCGSFHCPCVHPDQATTYSSSAKVEKGMLPAKNGKVPPVDRRRGDMYRPPEEELEKRGREYEERGRQVER